MKFFQSILFLLFSLTLANTASGLFLVHRSNLPSQEASRPRKSHIYPNNSTVYFSWTKAEKAWELHLFRIDDLRANPMQHTVLSMVKTSELPESYYRDDDVLVNTINFG